LLVTPAGKTSVPEVLTKSLLPLELMALPLTVEYLTDDSCELAEESETVNVNAVVPEFPSARDTLLMMTDGGWSLSMIVPIPRAYRRRRRRN
jgi:hypothetical protein